jgi:AraC-like DNA-binding protein
MRSSDKDLSENDIRPAHGDETVVRADSRDTRAWLAGAPVCLALSHHQIRHLGVARMPAPFAIVRTRLGGSYFLSCFGGEGRVLVDGRWKKCVPGQAFLLPRGTRQAFHTPSGRCWEYCWVRYQELADQQPIAAAQTPVFARHDSEPLRLAIMGLHRECSTTSVPAAVEHWVELIHHYVRQFAQPACMDRRLWNLWEKVGQALGKPWTIGELAAEANLSEKQLQRLCRKELGRNPRQHLIWLRMRSAAELLTSTSAKIETIASQVGYQNPFVFSSMFKRVMGWPPSEYPGRSRSI